MLNFAVPSPPADAAETRLGRVGQGTRFRNASTPPASQAETWVDWNEPPPEPRRWSREEAQALARREPSLSPWWVVAAQVLLGALCAGIAGWWGGMAAAQSALYGAAVVVVAGALMARAATSPLAGRSPAAAAVGLIAFGAVKTVAVLVMLVAAPRVLPRLEWVAMLATLAVCLQTYWLGLAVRPKARS